MGLGVALVAVGLCRGSRAQPDGEPEARRRRNVLFVIADDLRPQFSYLGFRDVRTPNIDRLAAEGVTFSRTYCQAPACNPSRNSFLTGLYPDVSKVFYFESVVSASAGGRGEMDFFSHMRTHGYLTWGVGKLWHWEPTGHPFTNGLDYYPIPGTYDQEWGCEPADGQVKCMPDEGAPWINGKVYVTDVHRDKIFDAKVARDAIEKIGVVARAYKKVGRPFLGGIGFHHPHTKWLIPRKLWTAATTWAVRPPDATTRDAACP